MNIKRLFLTAAVALTLAAPVPAFAWGGSPTHYSILYDLLSNSSSLPDAITGNPQAFVKAAVTPDLAWTPIFNTTGRNYVHTMDFAKSLLGAARNDSEMAMAYAWGAHLAADLAGERSGANPSGYIPEVEPMHQLVEVAVDTVIFYTFPPPYGLTSWDQVTINIDPKLLFRASINYSQQMGQVPLVWPWMVNQALNGLKTANTAEFDYIKLKKDACLSLTFLKELTGKGILPSADFEGYYDQSVDAAAAWVADMSGLNHNLSGASASQVTHTPVPASLFLLGSGLLGLGLLGYRRKRG
jgi:hypothetical protein